MKLSDLTIESLKEFVSGDNKDTPGNKPSLKPSKSTKKK